VGEKKLPCEAECEHTFTLLQLRVTTGHFPASGACAPPPFLSGLKSAGWGCSVGARIGALLGGVGPQGEPLALSASPASRSAKGASFADWNGHALAHFEKSQHPVFVKHGATTPEGNDARVSKWRPLQKPVYSLPLEPSTCIFECPGRITCTYAAHWER